ncbi:ParB/RepB/Spo0J family partition protein [Methylobacillus flagellatus]|uniref:Chromosome segregation DNA-binding protein n=1 Tax=Methylobacillus flagellatus (strain ATCC 51484 / DSM 6875 / VKM B-1610 / KT) TaxID=265072 RepID=Q1GXM2_METFK|nr:ParB/RepB/Spo0J family partition protein [Methylobacillus flagellatus]ABE51015.1 chromosome segregation DNA-binding protein [Methylobacillus flagellatus KT]
MVKLKGLGRGLDALLAGDAETVSANDAPNTLLVSQMQPGKYQPRTHMDQASLASLADSIRAQGIMQPILVREVAAGKYEIIAGERRWRAAKLAGLTEVPVLVRDIPDESALAMALIENIQRENLNPLEEAQGIQRLINEFNMTHQAAADAVGRSRSVVTNLLRLQNLSNKVQEMLMEGQLDMGHARALLSLPDANQVMAAELIVQKQLSVREAEKLVKQLSAEPQQKPAKVVDRDVLRLQEDLSELLGATVEIRAGKKGNGEVKIHYGSLDQLDALIERFKGGNSN